MDFLLGKTKSGFCRPLAMPSAVHQGKLQGVISKCEADVFRGVCLCRYARPAEQIPPNEKIELSSNEGRAPERNCPPEQFRALLCPVSKRQLLPLDSTTSRRPERASAYVWSGLISWDPVSPERFHRNGEGNLPCLPSDPAGPAGLARLNSRGSMSSRGLTSRGSTPHSQ
jgi:hypothetical protein